jgi:hypothetical protein
MNRVQMPARQPSLYRAPSQPQFQELSATDNAVLLLRQPRYPPIDVMLRLFSMNGRGKGRRI